MFLAVFVKGIGVNKQQKTARKKFIRFFWATPYHNREFSVRQNCVFGDFLTTENSQLCKNAMVTGVIARLGVKIEITLGFLPVLHTLGVYYQSSKAF